MELGSPCLVIGEALPYVYLYNPRDPEFPLCFLYIIFWSNSTNLEVLTMEGSHAPWGTKKRLGIGLLMFSTKESSKHVFSLLNFIFFNLIFWAAFLISRCHSSNSSTIAVLRLKRVGAFGCLSYYDSAVHAVQVDSFFPPLSQLFFFFFPCFRGKWTKLLTFLSSFIVVSVLFDIMVF